MATMPAPPIYAVLRYCNCHKDDSFEILKTFYSFKKADDYALDCVIEDNGELDEDDYKMNLSHCSIRVPDYVAVRTKGDGYRKNVYVIVKLPEPDDKYNDDDEVEDEEEEGEEEEEEEEDEEDEDRGSDKRNKRQKLDS